MIMKLVRLVKDLLKAVKDLIAKMFGKVKDLYKGAFKVVVG